MHDVVPGCDGSSDYRMDRKVWAEIVVGVGIN